MRSELDLDDPDRGLDPGTPAGGGFGERQYWCDVDGIPKPQDDVAATHNCAQGDIIESVTWDGTMYVLFIRVSQDCSGNQGQFFPSCTP